MIGLHGFKQIKCVTCDTGELQKSKGTNKKTAPFL